MVPYSDHEQSDVDTSDPTLVTAPPSPPPSSLSLSTPPTSEQPQPSLSQLTISSSTSFPLPDTTPPNNHNHHPQSSHDNNIAPTSSSLTSPSGLLARYKQFKESQAMQREQSTGSWWKDTLIHQYVNLTTEVARPKFPKYFTSNFYLTFNDPHLEEIQSAAISERVKIRSQLRSHRLGQDKISPLLREFGRIVHNRIRRWIQTPHVATILFLILLGVIAAIASVLIEVMLSKLVAARQRFASLTNDYYTNWLLWITYGLFFAFLSSCCVQHISPYIVGSGMPEMKTIISGIKMGKVLSLRTMIAKFFGVATTISAGFVVGRVGPFSHIIACLAEQLLKIRLFKRLSTNDFVRCNILSAACAAGVSATFGAPIGGVLFSVEITSTYFLVSNVWRGVLCSMICAFFFYVSRQLGYVNHVTHFLSLFPSNFTGINYKPYEYGLFIVLGICIGVLGGMFITIFVALIKERNKRPFLRDAKYWTVLLLCVIIGLVDFHIPLLKNPPGKVMNMLFGIIPLDTKFNKYLHLAMYVSFKYTFTILSLCLPIPSGQVVQSFMMGAGAGRFFGELMADILPGGSSINPAGYAVLGACSWAASTTRAYSMILIVLEITGQLNYLVPCMVCTVSAVTVASCISESIYDIMIKVRNLPYLSMPSVYAGQAVLAFNIMKTDVNVITLKSSMADVVKLLKTHEHDSFPVVNNEKERVLLGEAQRAHVEEMIQRYQERQDNLLNEGTTGDVVIHEVDLELLEKETPVATTTSNNAPFNDQSTHFHYGDGQHSNESSEGEHTIIPQPKGDNSLVLPNPLDDIGTPIDHHSSMNSSTAQLLGSFHAEQEQSTLRNRKHPSDSHSDEDSNNSHPEEKGMRHVIQAAKYILLNKGTRHEMTLQVDPSPFCITELTSMNKIYYLYTMLGLSHAWVVSFGRLTGVLTKSDLVEAGKSMEF